MIVDEVESCLQSLCAELPEYQCETGRRRGTPYLRVINPSEPERWAVVSTPGENWVSLDVNDGFSHDVLDDFDIDEIRALLAEFVQIGIAYLKAPSTEIKPVGKRFPVITLSTPSGKIDLRRSVTHNVRELLTFRRT